MKNSIYALGVLTFGLAGCGGGGGGDSVSGVSSSNGLEGTWIQTNVNYVLASGDVFKVRRQTIVVTKQDDFLYFTDCISGASLAAQVVDDQVDFVSAGVPNLLVENNSTLTTSLVSGSLGTDVELQKVSSDKTVSVADVSLTEPANISSWDQVCLETIVDQFLPDEVKIKAVHNSSETTVGVNLELGGDIAAGLYTFPSGSSDVDGYVTEGADTRNLLNPVGSIVISEVANTYLDFNLAMDNNVNANSDGVEGRVEIDSSWLSYE
ncbi:hypothetical protein [Ketobacter alkanivorans]|uniref:Uncharacterized protein n=1 Tax=Ketobacter alkanivorans TaxID=1917421 RepID=A0A2K9LM09_9GAMM|nr:hypothetical protein [Ketobacter alkanivorans]AUM13312.1 hypothetical protein Kalk_13150 [Ketobacter alkanivorans]